MTEQSTTPLSHITQLLEAALPYVNQQSRSHFEVLLKASDLMQSVSHTNTYTACDIHNEPLDLEGLCLSLQSVGNPREQDFINTILNFLQTRKLYQTYQNMRDILPASEENRFTQTQLLPLIEHFFQSYQKKMEGGSPV
ncbi:MAG: hypothetical protein II073_03900 [Lachnospiraceae bacterium]|nr:hypothetical protein [Lachnospiraceae bacterium]